MRLVLSIVFLLLFTTPALASEKYYLEFIFKSDDATIAINEYYLNYSPEAFGLPSEAIGFAMISTERQTVAMPISYQASAPSPCFQPQVSRDYLFGANYSQRIVRHVCQTSIPGLFEVFFTDTSGAPIDTGSSISGHLAG